MHGEKERQKDGWMDGGKADGEGGREDGDEATSLFGSPWMLNIERP